MQKQRTIKNPIVIEGIGVHSGLRASVFIRNAKEDTGIIFVNSRFDDSIKIGEIIPENAQYATIIKSKSWYISTVEHLMASIIALGIDNLILEVDGPEVPIMDGSSKPFIDALIKAEIIEQNADKRFITPKKILKFFDEKHGRSLEITPAEKLDNNFDKSLYVDYQADFDHPLIGSGVIKCVISDKFFIDEIAPARTFGFLEQLPMMRQNGLAKGASLENTVVVGESGFLNSKRFDDEFVRHKFLDLIGDLALLGKPLAGKIHAKRTGHNFNRLIIEHFINNPMDWELI